MDVWELIQNQILGMQWLNDLLGAGLSALGLDLTGRLGGRVPNQSGCCPADERAL